MPHRTDLLVLAFVVIGAIAAGLFLRWVLAEYRLCRALHYRAKLDKDRAELKRRILDALKPPETIHIKSNDVVDQGEPAEPGKHTPWDH